MNYYETEKYVFVHGWLPENGATLEERKNATDEAWEKARWTKWVEMYNAKRPLEDKTLVCGHVPAFYASRYDSTRGENNADIFYGDGLIAIDAGTFDTKQINVLVIEDKM